MLIMFGNVDEPHGMVGVSSPLPAQIRPSLRTAKRISAARGELLLVKGAIP